MAITISDIPFQVSHITRKLKPRKINIRLIFPFPLGDFLLRVRGHCVLLHGTTDGVVPVLHVPVVLPAHLLRGAKCGSGCGSRNERPEWCLLGPCHVRALPPVLRILRQLRCDTRVPALDHIPVLHPLRIRGHRFGHLWLWPGEAEVLPDVLPLQVPHDDTGGAGHAGRQLYIGHCCPDHNLLGPANHRLPVLALEDSDGEISGRNLVVYDFYRISCTYDNDRFYLFVDCCTLLEGYKERGRRRGATGKESKNKKGYLKSIGNEKELNTFIQTKRNRAVI